MRTTSCTIIFHLSYDAYDLAPPRSLRLQMRIVTSVAYLSYFGRFVYTGNCKIQWKWWGNAKYTNTKKPRLITLDSGWITHKCKFYKALNNRKISFPVFERPAFFLHECKQFCLFLAAGYYVHYNPRTPFLSDNLLVTTYVYVLFGLARAGNELTTLKRTLYRWTARSMRHLHRSNTRALEIQN
jgi:hypothetical protein